MIKKDKQKEQSTYLKKAKEIASKINLKDLGNNKNYDSETIINILESTVELTEDEYVKLTLEHRKERRTFFERDINAYVWLMVNYHDKVQNIIKKARLTILDILGINNNDFEEQIRQMMEKKNDEGVYQIRGAFRQQLQGHVKSTKNISFDVGKQITKFQIKKLQQQYELIKKILLKLSQSKETALLTPMIFREMLNDYIYNQYGVEDEDQTKLHWNQEFAKDKEFIILNEQLEQSMQSLLFQIIPCIKNVMQGCSISSQVLISNSFIIQI